ncbi:MAG: transposase [Acidimicrobiia bacterium]|nr:transposase [Acidimicrobiia bacterium]
MELPGSRGHPDSGGDPQRRGGPSGCPAKYPAEFRREAIARVEEPGRPVAEVARSLEIAEGTLWNWVKTRPEATERAADPESAQRIRARRAQAITQKTAQQEIDLRILRKAAAYFAKGTNR